MSEHPFGIIVPMINESHVREVFINSIVMMESFSQVLLVRFGLRVKA